MILELNLITTQDFDIDVAASAISHAAAVGKLDLAVVQLCQGGHTYTRNTPKATVDGDVATYDGYADGVVTWTGSRLTDDGKLELQGTIPEFNPNGAVVSNMINNLALYNAAKTKLYAVANFEGEGLPMRSALDNLIAALAVRLSSPSLVRVIT